MSWSEISWVHILLGLQVVLLFAIWRAVVSMESALREDTLKADLNRVAIAVEAIQRRGSETPHL